MWNSIRSFWPSFAAVPWAVKRQLMYGMASGPFSTDFFTPSPSSMRTSP
jgi:hypothetical protein